MIDSRFQQNLLDVKIDPKYNLVITRWGLCYLTDEDVDHFLKRCHYEITNSMTKPCPMIFYESIHDTRRHEHTIDAD